MIGLALGLAYGCAAPEAEPAPPIGRYEYDPAKWGKLYPQEYETYLQTRNPRPAGESKYKRGGDVGEVKYDKLSEFPWMALLYHGWGFGVEYNEPRGHYYMLIDQQEVDSSRVKAGAVCLACKSPYINRLVRDNGMGFFKIPYEEGLKKIPAKDRKLGVSCIDCHDNRTMELRVQRGPILQALITIGKPTPANQDMKSVVCGQCHASYIITKDKQMQSTDMLHPWGGGKWGDISIEDIIKYINSSPANLEWTQQVTGFKLGFIRHPEFELYSRGSQQWKKGVTCPDCHMGYTKAGAEKVTDHNMMSPLKNDMRTCAACHGDKAESLRAEVIAIQDKTVILLNRAGYETAAVAKLFELTNAARTRGATIDQPLYDQAKNDYVEAFYRVVFLGAENSVGFHNPPEAERIANDAFSFASRAEDTLRQALDQADVDAPDPIDLELDKYLNNRGAKGLNFQPEQEFK